MKEPTSVPVVWAPTVNGDSKMLQGGGEVTAMKLTAGGGSAFVKVYDCQTSEQATNSNLKWVLDASTTDNDSQIFESPLIFERGVFMVIEQGGDFQPYVCLAMRKYVN